MGVFLARIAAGIAVLTVAIVASQPHRSFSTADAQEAGQDVQSVVVQRRVDPNVLAQTHGYPYLEELGYEVLNVPEGMTREEFLQELSADPEIVSAEPDARVYAAAAPNDPHYANQSGYLSSIDVPEAWDLSVGREAVTVAVLDTGADTSHPDLASRLWTNSREIAGNGVDDDGNGCVDDIHGCRFVGVDESLPNRCGYRAADGIMNGNIRDDNGKPGSRKHSHGTLVAGTIGAAGNNGIGVSGVAWDVRLMIVKVLDCGGPEGDKPNGQLSDIAYGINYARRMGADIINLSLSTSPDAPGGDLSMVRHAIAAAEADGIIIVTAAGNGGSSPNPGVGYPGAYRQFSNLVTVGASDWRQGNQWARFSSYGPAVDLAAPGTEITSTIRTDVGLTNPYGRDSGTSFSTPIVAGMFALMKAQNSRLGHEQLIALAKNTATPAPPAPHEQPWAGAGIINAGKAVGMIPMLITGSALHDWMHIGANVPVEARIGGERCGATTTDLIGPVSRFELLVASDATIPGCGAPGRAVELYIDGAPAEPILRWGNPRQEILHTGQEISSVSPPPGPLIVQTLSPGWNNVAHFEEPGELPEVLSALSPAWTSIYAWDEDNHRYLRAFDDAPDYVQTLDALERFEAFWVYTEDEANAASVNPEPPAGRTIELREGWNNFVYTGKSREANAALSELAGMYTAVFHYDNERAKWLSFMPGVSRAMNSMGGLLQMQVYWIYMTEDATLIMD